MKPNRKDYKNSLDYQLALAGWQSKAIDNKFQNQELRDLIVDAADFYDGRETQIIGRTLRRILDGLGIKDVPEFYSKEHIDKFIKELGKDRK